MSIFRAVSSVTASFVMIAFLASCSESSNPPLRVGLNAWPGYALLFVAQEKGYFAEEGVEVELIELATLSDVRRAFERGQIDGMATSLVEVLEVSEDSSRRALISIVADYSNGADVILAQRSIDSMAALAGHRIGIEPGTLTRFILARALQKYGMKDTDVEIVGLSQQAMASALSKGEVDAVVTFPPASTELERKGNVQKIFTSAEIPGEIVDVISFEAGVIETRSAEINAFTRAWGRAVTFTLEHPQEAYEILAPHLGMSVDELGITYEEMMIIPADDHASFLSLDGPVVEGVDVLRAILWPDENEADRRPAESFFAPGVPD